MKYLFLALLSLAPTHGYDLMQMYENLFSAVLPSLNAGQIYTTLSRLERDGLVRKDSIEQEGKPNKIVYELTSDGRQALLEWLGEPLAGPRIKDNFYLKLVSARMSDLIEPLELIESQRGQYFQTLHDLNNLILQPDIKEDPQKLILIQGAILHLKADLQWLDLCQEAFE